MLEKRSASRGREEVEGTGGDLGECRPVCFERRSWRVPLGFVPAAPHRPSPGSGGPVSPTLVLVEQGEGAGRSCIGSRGSNPDPPGLPLRMLTSPRFRFPLCVLDTEPDKRGG